MLLAHFIQSPKLAAKSVNSILITGFHDYCHIFRIAEIMTIYSTSSFTFSISITKEQHSINQPKTKIITSDHTTPPS